MPAAAACVRERADDVVGLDAFDHQERPAMRAHELVQRLDLRDEIVGHRRADSPCTPDTSRRETSCRARRTRRRSSPACRRSTKRRNIDSTPRSAPVGSPFEVRRSGSAWNARYRYDEPSTRTSVGMRQTHKIPELIDPQALYTTNGQEAWRVLGIMAEFADRDRTAARHPAGRQHVRQRAHQGRASVLREDARRSRACCRTRASR